MRFHNQYRTIAAGFSLALLASCAAEESSGETEASPADAEAQSALSEESLVMAETAWLTVSNEGEVFTTYLDPDGRYRDLHEGTVRYGGSWEQNSRNELCFVPDSGEGACWTHKSPGLDGVMRATNRSGRAIEVRRVAYEPPPEAAQPSERPPSESEPPDSVDAAENGDQGDGG